MAAVIDTTTSTPLGEAPPTFHVNGEQIQLADQALDLLGRSFPEEVFQRGRLLVRVVANGIVPRNKVSLFEGTPVIEMATVGVLRDVLARKARWVATRSKRDVDILPPGWLIENIQSRASWKGLPRLEGVVESPALLSDGRILSEPGYDARSRLLYFHPKRNWVSPPTVKDKPSLEESQSAVKTLLEPLQDFPFRTPGDQAAALAAILSLVARHAIEGCVPMFVLRSPTPGSGKSLLADVISLVGAGRPAPRLCPDDDPSETRKLVMSVALAGLPVVLLDNLTGRLGNKVLASALTAESWEDRFLGENRMVEAPLRTVWIGTGNNLSFKGDLGRRIVVCDLDPQLEHPEDRTEFAHTELLRYVETERPKLVAAALTLLKGYLASGSPVQDPHVKGSYECWSRLVRQSLLWAGVGDPDASRETIRAEGDSELASLRDALSNTHRVMGSDPWTVADLTQRADFDDQLKDALLEFTQKDRIDRNRIGIKLRQSQDRIVDHLAFCRNSAKTNNSSATWRIKNLNLLRVTP